VTVDERAWIEAILRLGCIVCIREALGQTPAEVHHMLSGGRRMGHKWTLPLCFNHHRAGRDDEQCISRDHAQRRFENRYGTERELHADVKARVIALGYYREKTA
jgi:hypothetical protein